MLYKKRVPEKEQEMDDYEEVLSYYKAHQKLKKKSWDIYDLIARNILKNINIKEGKVLDVACGYGGLMNALRKHNNNLEFVGIDMSKAMLEVGRKHVANKKIKFLRMRGDNLEFPDETFDYILCKDSFHHFKNPVKTLQEMYRVLKKDGYIYAIDLRRDAPEEAVLHIIQLASELNIENMILYVESHRASYTLKEMKKIVEKSGIKKYKLSSPRITKDFLKQYNLKEDDWLTASDYLKEKWVLLIKKE